MVEIPEIKIERFHDAQAHAENLLGEAEFFLIKRQKALIGRTVSWGDHVLIREMREMERLNELCEALRRFCEDYI